jgi:uncharacterized protein YcbX
MGGEALDRVGVDERGLVGDRWFAVEDADGRFASGKDTRRFRRRDAIFDYAARTTPTGGVVVERQGASWSVCDPALAAELSGRMDAPVRIRPEGTVPHQDAAAVSIVGTASLAWCARRWGGSADERRLRANVLVETDEPFVEDGWVGRELCIGSTRLRVTEPALRCRMLDITQDGARPESPWLRPLGRERQLNLAVYADTLEPGSITVGDLVEVAGRR